MIWLIAALDLVGAVWLLRRAFPRERRDREAVLAVGLLLLLCAVSLAGISVWRAALQPAEPGLPPAEPVPGISV